MSKQGDVKWAICKCMKRKSGDFLRMTKREFQNGNCWYTPRLFSYEWQIQDLQVTSLYEWQVKDLKQLCFQRIASGFYEWQTKDLQKWIFRSGSDVDEGLEGMRLVPFESQGKASSSQHMVARN